MLIQNLTQRFFDIKTNTEEKILLGLFIYKLVCESGEYRISHSYSFASWISSGIDFDISNISDSLSGLMRLNGQLNVGNIDTNAFYTLEREKQTLGDTAGSQSKVLWKKIWAIKELPEHTTFKSVIKAYHKA